MPIVRKPVSEVKRGLDAAEKAELRALLADVPDVVGGSFDIGEDASPALIAAVEYARTHGATLRAVACHGGGWIIDSRTVGDLRRLAAS